MDDRIDIRDHELLEADRYTFFVLDRIMDGDCSLLLSDHEKLIICFTCHPYPVWIWTPDEASAEDMERAYVIACENGLMESGFRFNIKYGLAEYLVERAAKDGRELKIETNMFAYECLRPQRPDEDADGCIRRCSEEDIDELTDFVEMFHDETGMDRKDRAVYRRDAEDHIASGNMFFWRNGEGRDVASCRYGPNGDLASINLVFTLPEYRRRHYAENLVYQVTLKAMEAGYVPMLYTDADYEASNACYEKIGYVLKGKLCTIAVS